MTKLFFIPACLPQTGRIGREYASACLLADDCPLTIWILAGPDLFGSCRAIIPRDRLFYSSTHSLGSCLHWCEFASGPLGAGDGGRWGFFQQVGCNKACPHIALEDRIPVSAFDLLSLDDISSRLFANHFVVGARATADIDIGICSDRVLGELAFQRRHLLYFAFQNLNRGLFRFRGFLNNLRLGARSRLRIAPGLDSRRWQLRPI